MTAMTIWIRSVPACYWECTPPSIAAILMTEPKSPSRKRARPTPVAGLEAPPDQALRPALTALAQRDRDIARAYRGCGLPPVRARPPGFASLMHIIMAQQVSAHAAKAIIERLDAATSAAIPGARRGCAAGDRAQPPEGALRPGAVGGRAGRPH